MIDVNEYYPGDNVTRMEIQTQIHFICGEKFVKSMEVPHKSLTSMDFTGLVEAVRKH